MCMLLHVQPARVHFASDIVAYEAGLVKHARQSPQDMHARWTWTPQSLCCWNATAILARTTD